MSYPLIILNYYMLVIMTILDGTFDHPRILTSFMEKQR